MKIYEVTDPLFHEYGQVVEGYSLEGLAEIMAQTPCPENGTVYKPGDSGLEALPVSKELSEGFFGGMPIQTGYCNGHNVKLNALEYHRSSEINIPVGGDIILLLAKRADLDRDFRMDTGCVRAFRVPAGTMVEIYATTLHYAPCAKTMSDGFRVVVVLPKGTNCQLTAKVKQHNAEDALLFAANKWLIGHPDGENAPGVFLGLSGTNLDVTRD